VSTYFDVCIRGAGLVGQTLALLLAQQRLRVALVGRATSSEPLGQASSASEHRSDIRAYALNAASRQCLQSLRIWPDAACQPVLTMQVHGDEGGELQFSSAQQSVEALAWIAPAGALAEMAEQAIRFQPLIEMVPPEQAAQVQAPLTAVCEGKASQTRAAYGVAFDTQPYAMSAVAARLACAQSHNSVAQQWFRNDADAGEVLALLPMAPEAGGAGNLVALVWSVSTERAAALKAMPEDEFLNALQTACGSVWGNLQLRSERATWPLALSRATQMVGPGFALLGDAAHTVHPLAGQGLNVGLADAQQLAQTLAAREYWRGLGDEKLLRRYERARAGAVAQMGWVTHGLHSLFAHGDARLQSLRNWGLTSFDRSGPLKTWAARQAMGLV
jgi:2-polyprenyl-6-methoxyphenol hydroxylase-like FAD-dependent oxidoreductase